MLYRVNYDISYQSGFSGLAFNLLNPIMIYYDNHTNTTGMSPKYYIYSLERSNCLIISIMIHN